MLQKVNIHDWGLIGYEEAWKKQESLMAINLEEKAKSRLDNDTPNPLDVPTTHHLIFCEHPPVYTLGKNGKMDHVLISNHEMEERGIGFFQTNRGGDITFHGPEQIVGYPILDLEKLKTDIGWYLRNLEEVIIQTIAEFGIKGERSTGETGVWIDAENIMKARKICAMGVRCSRWVTMHGFALNVNTDLSYFNHIIPCGIQHKQVTSIEKETGKKISVLEVKEILTKKFEEIFEVSVVK